jgi:glucose-1-phosphate thymidylyltransferase
MKGIILAGGKGTRLFPLTTAISKQLLPVYNKPMIYYPLSMLMMANIREILVISSPECIQLYKDVLGSGDQWGISFSYEIQPEPQGIAQSFLIGEEFIGDDCVGLILGDNIFYGERLWELLAEHTVNRNEAIVFAYQVNDPERYGVVEFDQDGNALSIEEKPKVPRSNYAIPGIYFYDNTVVEKAKKLKFSNRGELEITDLNKMYLEEQKLRVVQLGRGTAWLDAGTHESLLQAANFVYAIEERQGLLVSSPEEIALHNGWITKETLAENLSKMGTNEYTERLYRLISQSRSS